MSLLVNLEPGHFSSKSWRRGPHTSTTSHTPIRQRGCNRSKKLQKKGRAKTGKSNDLNSAIRVQPAGGLDCTNSSTSNPTDQCKSLDQEELI
ncbi:hypothetical protein M758_7G046100 [Ceratodon purpureus]|nr:hypothetical protein M758_7G046100 [Ceratodon purpureus]